MRGVPCLFCGVAVAAWISSVSRQGCHFFKRAIGRDTREISSRARERERVVRQLLAIRSAVSRAFSLRAPTRNVPPLEFARIVKTANCNAEGKGRSKSGRRYHSHAHMMKTRVDDYRVDFINVSASRTLPLFSGNPPIGSSLLKCDFMSSRFLFILS